VAQFEFTFSFTDAQLDELKSRSMSKKWRSSRLRTLKGGSIQIGATRAIDCIIRNMSETGALLTVESPIGIPDDFTLLIKPELRKRPCQVAWRSADRIGVRFI
jgi:hypothetical protein